MISVCMERFSERQKQPCGGLFDFKVHKTQFRHLFAFTVALNIPLQRSFIPQWLPQSLNTQVMS